MEGTESRLPALGHRGGGWVALQVVLFVVAAVVGWLGMRWPSTARPWLWVAGIVALVAGVGLLLAGGAGLGKQLTPFPRPVDTGVLRQDGIYGLVRHPIYGGVLVLLLGWALVSSPLTLIPSLLAAGFFDAKRRREEVWLMAKYPDYTAYAERVPRRFVPFVW
ncbi:MAG TPA: isoprenylcysteine carboxylmethyltransferase family protein [Propionicimonas sp.]|jgi:protein-S-isoprenylcysteine O-methyltransferase Ste14